MYENRISYQLILYQRLKNIAICLQYLIIYFEGHESINAIIIENIFLIIRQIIIELKFNIKTSVPMLHEGIICWCVQNGCSYIPMCIETEHVK